jgi:uncharacterized protein involved in exopolysaccharide biosynthesis
LIHSETKTRPDPAPELIFAEPSAFEPPRREEFNAIVGRLRILWENRRWLQRAAIAGVVFGFLLAFTIPTQFQSTTQLMPPDNQSSSGMAMLASLAGKSGLPLGAMAGDFLGLQGTGDLFIGILRSRTLEDRMVSRFDLKRVYRAKFDDRARKQLEQNSSINQDRKSGIISITVTDHDPERAEAIAQGYVIELDHLAAEVSTSAARRERIFLEQRLQAVKGDLDQASEDFSHFASKNGAIDIKEQGRAMLDAAATLMGELIAAKSQLKGLEEIYSTNNVRVKAVEARISELRSQLEKMGGEKDVSIDDDGPAGSSSYPSIRQLPVLGLTYADLYRRTKIEEAVYETLTQQYELAKVQEAREIPSVKVLDVARLPERKSFPPRAAVIVLCLVLSMMAAAVWVLSRARWAEIDPLHPGKVLAEEVFRSARASARQAIHPPWGWLKGVHRRAHTPETGAPAGSDDAQNQSQTSGDPEADAT